MTQVEPVMPPSSADRDETLSGMLCVDTSGNPRIPLLMEMVAALSRASEPKEVLRIFSQQIEGLFGLRGYVSISTRGLKPGQYKITRFMHQDESSLLGESNPWNDWEKLPIHTGGFFGEIVRTAYPELIHNLSVKNDSVLGNALESYRSLMAIPLFDNGEPLNWAIFLREDPQGFTVQELEQAILRSNLIGNTVKNVLIAKQLREAHSRIRAEIEHVADIQRALLPNPLPNIPGLQIATSYETFDQAGGDHYDFRPLCEMPDGSGPDPDGLWSILIADASGHGPAAAVVVAMLHAILHAYPHQPDSAAAMLNHANCHLAAKRIESSFVTAFLGVFDPKSKRLTYARAGHNPPLLKNPGSGGEVLRLEAVGGVPLGVEDQSHYEDATIELKSGQTLVLYTDGITEARNSDGVMFGVEGIESALEDCSGQLDCVVKSITEPLGRHQKDKQPDDDQTVVAMQIL